MKSLVRLAGTRGTVLLARAGPASSLLYRLDPETLAVTTWSIPGASRLWTSPLPIPASGSPGPAGWPSS
ncbi:MAG: hypothetical protein IPF66_05785 [Holophagales bacterium]|nr:hypothetical protein [Holophagales bacterium]